MTKLILGLLTFLAAGQASAKPHPPTMNGGLGSGGVVRGFANHGDISLMAESEFFDESDSRQVRSVVLGAYDQLAEHLRGGIFYGRYSGLRHDEDWVSSSGRWIWVDTRNRSEDFAIFDLSPRTLFDFLPGGPWLGEFKTRFLYNMYNQQTTAVVRPSLTYFLGERGNIHLQYELNFPLNYGVQTTSERWLYLGGLYHACSSFDVGPFIAWGWQTWGSPANFINSGGAPYTVTSQDTLIGLTAVFQVGM